MNPVAVIHKIGASLPLIGRKVGMNRWYGVRIPEAFASEDRWFKINHYGGKLLLGWGMALGATAGVGSLLDRQYWVTYNIFAVFVILGGLIWIIALINRHARSTGN